MKGFTLLEKSHFDGTSKWSLPYRTDSGFPVKDGVPLQGEMLPSSQAIRKRSSLMGFTLLELLVVMVIIGILVSIGVPIYRGVVQKIEKDEAKAMLKMVQTAEKVARIESSNKMYTNCTNTSNCNTLLDLDMDLNTRWNYFVSNATNTSFCAVAVDSAAVSFHINATDYNASIGAACP